MSRGRKPGITVNEAVSRCFQSGFGVFPADRIQNCADLVVVSSGKIRLIRVRRPRIFLKDKEAVAFRYCREIANLRAFPSSDFLEKELMVLRPDGSWHTFRILPDTIERIE